MKDGKRKPVYKSTALFNAHRGHGGERRIRTSSPAYEAGVLPLHHHRDIFKAHYVAFSIPKTDASTEVLSVPFLV